MAKRKPSAPKPTAVESIRHKDKRTNTPTEELRDVVAEDEKAPKTMLYPRDVPFRLGCMKQFDRTGIVSRRPMIVGRAVDEEVPKRRGDHGRGA